MCRQNNQVRQIDHYWLFEIIDQLDMSGSKEQTFHLKEVSFRNCYQNESLEMQITKKYYFSNLYFHVGNIREQLYLSRQMYMMTCITKNIPEIWQLR